MKPNSINVKIEIELKIFTTVARKTLARSHRRLMMKFAYAILVLAATTCGENPTEDDEESKSWAELKTKLEEQNKKMEVSRQADGTRQKDVIGAVKQLIKSELRALNASGGLHDMIVTEIRKYHASAELKQIKTINGEAKSDNGAGVCCAYENVLNAFKSDGSIMCVGWTGSAWNKPFPHLILYEFPSYHIPAKFTFRRYGSDSSYSQTPKTWKFVGSRDENCDENSHWDELCGDLSGQKIVYNVDVGCEVPKYVKPTAYKCLGIRVYSVPQARLNDGNPHHNCVKNMRFWEK